MVNYKSKYLEMKLKYINAKYKGGTNEVFDEIYYEEVLFPRKIKLINEFLELIWGGNNIGSNLRGNIQLRNEIIKVLEKLHSLYIPNVNKNSVSPKGWSLDRSKIKENPNGLDFNVLDKVVKQMIDIGIEKNPEGHKWDGVFVVQV